MGMPMLPTTHTPMEVTLLEPTLATHMSTLLTLATPPLLPLMLSPRGLLMPMLMLTTDTMDMLDTTMDMLDTTTDIEAMDTDPHTHTDTDTDTDGAVKKQKTNKKEPFLTD